MTAMNPLRPILNDTPASAVDIDWNFQTTEDFVANDVIKRDGSTAMEAPLNLLGSPPTLPTHAISKGYLDTAVIPVGVIWQFAGVAAPAGWALCDGTSKTTTDPLYAELFRVIGYTYGGVGGNFNLPQLGGRMPVGMLAGDSRFGALNAPGGNRNLIIPSHTHGVPQHVHGMTDHQHNRGAHAHGIAAHQHHMSHYHNVPFRKGYNVYTANDGGFGGAWKETNTTFKPNAPILAFSLRETALWTGEPPGGPDTASGQIVSPRGDFTDTNHSGIGQATSTDGDGATAGMTAAQNTGYGGPGTTNDANGAGSATDANLPPYVVVNFIIRIG